MRRALRIRNYAFVLLSVALMHATTYAAMAVAYADKSGTKLLTLADDTRPDAPAKNLSIAYCHGQAYPIQFTNIQAGGASSSGRNSSRNFKYDAGAVFKVTQGKIQDNETCLLVDAKFVAEHTTLPIHKPNAQNSKSANCDAIDLANLGSIRKRKIKNCWNIAQIGKANSLHLIEYVRTGNSMLASMVLLQEKSTAHIDYPATYNEMSVWREGDGGELQPTALNVIAAFMSDESIEFLSSDSGEEGDDINYFRTDSGKLKSLMRRYRYLSPE